MAARRRVAAMGYPMLDFQIEINPKNPLAPHFIFVDDFVAGHFPDHG
jgi:hypothetical protein